MEVGAVILAAGVSSRMGAPKQTLRFQGRSLLRHAALSALEGGCNPVIVVTGANSELSRRELDGLTVVEAFNAEWETGMASSIRVGLEALVCADPDATAALFMVCDQPHVTADVIATIVAAYRVAGSEIVASRYGGSFGVPALFGKTFFAELAGLQGEGGAKKVIERHASSAHFLELADAEFDVDTPEDYVLLKRGDRDVRR